jgi:hypothetical protein
MIDTRGAARRRATIDVRVPHIVSTSWVRTAQFAVRVSHGTGHLATRWRSQEPRVQVVRLARAAKSETSAAPVDEGSAPAAGRAGSAGQQWTNHVVSADRRLARDPSIAADRPWCSAQTRAGAPCRDRWEGRRFLLVSDRAWLPAARVRDRFGRAPAGAGRQHRVGSSVRTYPQA